MSLINRHPINYCILLVFCTIFFTVAYAKKPETTKAQLKRPAVPELKTDEYAVFIDEAYKIFKTKTHEEFELETSCFKKDKPECDAYTFAQVKPKNITLKHQGLNNFAAIHCADITGRNLIALDADRKEYNFCFFKDGAMVNSWSVYFKHRPVQVIK